MSPLVFACSALIGVHTWALFSNFSFPVKADSAFNPGKVIVGQISKVLPDQALYVRLPLQKSGMVALTDLRDSYVDNPLEAFEVNQILR